MWENHITLPWILYRLSACGMKLTETIKDRIRGCVYGQAIGDALGLGTEFMSREEVRRCYPDGLERYDQMIRDDHRSRWKPGSWTDDTDMMVCIAKARQDNHFDLHQVACNFKEWFDGNPLGIGRHTYNVLCFADYTKDPMKAADIVWRLFRCRSAANGGLMRTSIVGTSPLAEEEEIANICRLTHPDMRCVGSCVLYVKLIQGLIFRSEQLDVSVLKDIAARYDERIEEYIGLATHDDPSVLAVDDNAMGYTLKTMAVALWSLWHCHSFKEGLLAVVNMGGDADTNAAVACALLGAKYGFSTIPRYYVDNLVGRQLLEEICEDAFRDIEVDEK